ERRRSAVQPRRDPRQGTTGVDRAADGDARIPGARLGARHGECARRRGRVARLARRPRGPPRGGPVRVRASGRSAARSPRRGIDRRGRPSHLAQPDPRDARGLLRQAGLDAGGECAEARTRGRIVSATAAIALNVFRESVRDKILYNLVLFAVVMIGTSYLIGQLTAGQDVKIIKDLGLSATSVFGL